MTQSMTRAHLEARNWKERALPGFVGRAGPLWTRREEERWSYGLLTEAHHLNPSGIVHGGALLTLMDHAISTVAWEACGRSPCVTLQLDTQFVAAVSAGQFVEVRADVTRRTGKLLFMKATAFVDAQPVLAAQAILRIVAQRPSSALAGEQPPQASPDPAATEASSPGRPALK